MTPKGIDIHTLAMDRPKFCIKKPHYGILFEIFSATQLEFLHKQNFAKRPLHGSDSISRKFCVVLSNTCDVECEEDLKHFHTNEENAKGLLNIKQEFLSHYLLHLIVARMWQVVSLEKRRSGNEWLSAMLIPLYNVVQANAFGSRKLQR